MIIRQLKISRYRAIKDLTLHPNPRFNCLIGNGDSGKTTILNALSLLFSRTWQTNFFDTDFHNGDTKEPIEIEAVITEFPEELLSEQKLGLHTCGWDDSKKAKLDEPFEDTQTALAIRLRVNESLEPEWEVVGPNEATKRISHTDRAKLGLLLIQSERRNDFTWSRGSLVASASNTTSSLEEELCRLNRQILSETQLDLGNEIEDLLESVGTEIGNVGVDTVGELKAKLLPRSLSARNGNIAIFDDACPLEQKGTGTRKLAHFSLQSSMGKNISVLLIDEFEYGLEPHRIRQLLNYCRKGKDGSARQVFTTTHSPEVLRWLSTNELIILNQKESKHEATELQEHDHELLHNMPSALLSKKVVVCEGPTEVGICLGMENFWEKQHGEKSAAAFGVAFSNGMGAPQSGQMALKLAKLGYDVALFCDADEKNKISSVLEAGGTVLQWEKDLNTEKQIFKVVSVELAKKLYKLAKRYNHERGMKDKIAGELGIKPAEFDEENLLAENKSQQEILEAIGASAGTKKHSWYKTEAIAIEFGELLVEHLKLNKEDHLTSTINSLGNWIYG